MVAQLMAIQSRSNDWCILFSSTNLLSKIQVPEKVVPFLSSREVYIPASLRYPNLARPKAVVLAAATAAPVKPSYASCQSFISCRK